MKQQNDLKNTYGICTWKDISECNDCSLKAELKCRFQKKHLFTFIGSFLIFAIPAFVGVIIAGFGWFLLGWIGFWLFFFNFWESRILCCHCPFYAEEGKILHCIANYGSFKAWRFRPEPTNRLEKFQLIIGFSILIFYPLIFMILGNQYLILLLSIIGLIIFFSILLTKICSKCVNFSCPFNRVPKNTVDIYLKRNPVMRKAWEEHGYQID